MVVTSDDYMSIEILDEAYSVQDELRQLMSDLLERIVYLTKPDTSEKIRVIPYADFINIIERNIDKLTAGGYRPSDMSSTMDWLGELNDMRRLGYIDVNRWFESVEQITGLVYGIAYGSPVTGTFYTGDDLDVQLFEEVE